MIISLRELRWQLLYRCDVFDEIDGMTMKNHRRTNKNEIHAPYAEPNPIFILNKLFMFRLCVFFFRLFSTDISEMCFTSEVLSHIFFFRCSFSAANGIEMNFRWRNRMKFPICLSATNGKSHCVIVQLALCAANNKIK